MQDQRQLPYSDILYCNTSHVQDYIRIDIEAVGAYVILLGFKWMGKPFMLLPSKTSMSSLRFVIISNF